MSTLRRKGKFCTLSKTWYANDLHAITYFWIISIIPDSFINNIHNIIDICCSILNNHIITRKSNPKTKSFRKKILNCIKKKQLSSIIKRFLFVSVYDFSLFQYANLVFMLLVIKIIVIALWLTMKNEVGSSNHRKNKNRAKFKKIYNYNV